METRDGYDRENAHDGQAALQDRSGEACAHRAAHLAREDEVSCRLVQDRARRRGLFENQQIAFIAYDSEHHRVAIVGIPGVTPHFDGQARLHHMAFTYASLGDLVHTYERLKAAGIRPQFCINHGPTTSMYFFDPDKNQAELQVDNMPESEFAAYFASGEFAKDPIGVTFDPEALARRYHDGEPETHNCSGGPKARRQS
jgi:catechol 2,3-dioxygenase-like lactoylglutathione lyase family enzyme